MHKENNNIGFIDAKNQSMVLEDYTASTPYCHRRYFTFALVDILFKTPSNQ